MRSSAAITNEGTRVLEGGWRSVGIAERRHEVRAKPEKTAAKGTASNACQSYSGESTSMPN